jgi:murein DD-endopeptidase MepM/ murein hydrolase activator NlpD
MRIREAGVFAIGFAAGMMTIVVMFGLWKPGAPREKATEVVMAAPSVTLPPAGVLPAAPAPTMPPPTMAPLGGVPPKATPSPTQSSLTPSAPGLHLAMPLANVDPQKLSSTYNQVRDGHMHEALDIMAPRGTPVMAVAEGNVAKLFTSKQGGLTVYQFDNSQIWCYYYAHLDRYASGLKEGMLLRKGDVLGYVGSTGDASPSAPHLHFAVFALGPEREWWKGTAVDPLPLLK